MKTEYIHEQGVGRLNEDAISLNDTIFGVFDGATSLNAKKYKNGTTGGAMASEITRKIFARNNDSLKNLAQKANSAIYDEMIKNNVDTSDKTSLWSTSAAVVQLNDDSLEWMQIGDSLILIIYKDGSFKVAVTDYDHDSETLNMWKKISHKTDKQIFQVMGNQIKKVRKMMNVDYGVLNGETEFDSFIKSGKENLENISHVLLFTDGLFIPSENPSEKHDFQHFVELFRKGGLKEIRDYVRKIEQSDPECKQYPRFKKHDDIAAIAIDFKDIAVSCAA